MWHCVCVCAPQGGWLCRSSATSVRWPTTARRRSSSSTAPSTCRTCARRRSWWRMTVSQQPSLVWLVSVSITYQTAGGSVHCWCLFITNEDEKPQQAVSGSSWCLHQPYRGAGSVWIWTWCVQTICFIHRSQWLAELREPTESLVLFLACCTRRLESSVSLLCFQPLLLIQVMSPDSPDGGRRWLYHYTFTCGVVRFYVHFWGKRW